MAEQPDISGMHQVRMSVKENTLSDARLIVATDYLEYIEERGRGWVYIHNKILVGFAIIDLQEHNIRALFVHPTAEGSGIGRRLHDAMLDWYFHQSHHPIWLGTSPNTRAESFYRRAGWQPVGMHGSHELKLEMTHENWRIQQAKKIEL